MITSTWFSRILRRPVSSRSRCAAVTTAMTSVRMSSSATSEWRSLLARWRGASTAFRIACVPRSRAGSMPCPREPRRCMLPSCVRTRMRFSFESRIRPIQRKLRNHEELNRAAKDRTNGAWRNAGRDTAIASASESLDAGDRVTGAPQLLAGHPGSFNTVADADHAAVHPHRPAAEIDLTVRHAHVLASSGTETDTVLHRALAVSSTGRPTAGSPGVP